RPSPTSSALGSSLLGKLKPSGTPKSDFVGLGQQFAWQTERPDPSDSCDDRDASTQKRIEIGAHEPIES
ncbi:MAG: hypothetical protein ACLFNT_11555, partial [Spirochaetales bacterium]